MAQLRAGGCRNLRVLLRENCWTCDIDAFQVFVIHDRDDVIALRKAMPAGRARISDSVIGEPATRSPRPTRPRLASSEPTLRDCEKAEVIASMVAGAWPWDAVRIAVAQRSRDGLCCVLIACVPASRGRGVLIIVGIQFRIYYILGCRTSMSIVVCRAVDAWRHDHMDHGLLSSARAPGSQGSGRPDPAHRALIRLNSLPPFTMPFTVRQRPLLCCFPTVTTRTTSGPPSTRASIAMDGGVADTTCYYTGR